MEVLHNGLELPATGWPPRVAADDSREPLPVPYLEQRPEVVPIDVGRQLLVDDFLVDSTTLQRRFGKPEIHPASPVLSPETDEELDGGNCPMAAPFNDGVWHDPEDGLFKMWYMPGWFHSTALAYSHDGLHWERPKLDVVPGTNLVWPKRPTFERDGCLVWLDHEAENPAERFKMFQFYRYGSPSAEGDTSAGWLHTSPDGIHWSAPVVTTPVGDNSSFFYDPFRRKWCMSIRRGWPLRTRSIHQSDTFLGGARWNIRTDEAFWQRADRLDEPDPSRPDHLVTLYDVNVVAYESLMLGLFAIFRGPENDICALEGVPKMIDLVAGYSRDGFHFDRPDRTPFLACSRQTGDWNRAYLHAAGGVCLVVGDRLFIYFTGFSGLSPRLGPSEAGKAGRNRQVMYAGGSTGVATLRRDGFASMVAGADGGELTTRAVAFRGKHLFVNARCPHGELRVAVLDRGGHPFPGLDACNCKPFRADGTCARVEWTSGRDLSLLRGQPVRFRFHLRTGELFAFWVTDDPAGASYGYMGAGGPGFAKGRDLPPERQSHLR